MGQNIQPEKIEIHLVRLTEVYGKILNEKHVYKSVETALLLSNVIDMDHQNSWAIFHYLYGFQLVFWLNVMSNTLPIALTRLSGHYSTINSV